MALLVTLPTLVPQKTRDAVTENNYSFRQSLLLEKQFVSTPQIAAVTPPIYPGNRSQQEALPGELHRRSILPLLPLLPAAEMAWPYALSHMAPKFNFDYTDEELGAVSGITLT